MGSIWILPTLKGDAPRTNVGDEDVRLTTKGASPQSGSGILYPVVTKMGTQQFKISGITKDLNGNPLANCRVELYTTVDDTTRATQISDSGGNYYFFVPSNGYQYYIVAYLVGTPDVAGTTVNTLIGV